MQDAAVMTVTDHRIDGVRLSVNAAGTGPTVVFQHGMCADAGQAIEVFPPEGFHRITLECRGHGASEAGDPAVFGLARFADDLEALLDGLGRVPLAVGGLSMGAALALRLAVRRPDLVRALILVRPAWIADAAPGHLGGHVFAGGLLARHGPQEGRRQFDLSPIAADLAARSPDTLARLRAVFDRTPSATTAALLTRIGADGPGIGRDDIAALTIPTLVLATDTDPIHPLALAEELAGLVPGARLVPITAKSVDRHRYRADCRAALAAFLAALPA